MGVEELESIENLADEQMNTVSAQEGGRKRRHKTRGTKSRRVKKSHKVKNSRKSRKFRKTRRVRRRR